MKDRGKLIDDHAKLIEKLGDGTSVALEIWGDNGETKKGRDAVYKWKQNGVPWRWRGTVAALARKARVALPPNFLVPGHNAVGRLDSVRKSRAPV